MIIFCFLVLGDMEYQNSFALVATNLIIISNGFSLSFHHKHHIGPFRWFYFPFLHLFAAVGQLMKIALNKQCQNKHLL